MKQKKKTNDVPNSLLENHKKRLRSQQHTSNGCKELVFMSQSRDASQQLSKLSKESEDLKAQLSILEFKYDELISEYDSLASEDNIPKNENNNQTLTFFEAHSIYSNQLQEAEKHLTEIQSKNHLLSIEREKLQTLIVGLENQLQKETEREIDDESRLKSILNEIKSYEEKIDNQQQINSQLLQTHEESRILLQKKINDNDELDKQNNFEELQKEKEKSQQQLKEIQFQRDKEHIELSASFTPLNFNPIFNSNSDQNILDPDHFIFQRDLLLKKQNFLKNEINQLKSQLKSLDYRNSEINEKLKIIGSNEIIQQLIQADFNLFLQEKMEEEEKFSKYIKVENEQTEFNLNQIQQLQKSIQEFENYSKNVISNLQNEYISSKQNGYIQMLQNETSLLSQKLH